MSFIDELKRRNVFRVGIAYLVVSWLVLQVVDVVLGNIGAPAWLFKALLLVIGVGFPITLIVAWAFELTPEGLKRDHEVDEEQRRARPPARLNIVIIAGLSLALAYFAMDKFLLRAPAAAEQIGAVADSKAIGKSIIVLPFVNRSASSDDAYFVDGMHDDILTQLSKLSTLDKVISRTTAMSYSSTTKTISQIAGELGVATVLEGGVQRAGDTIRVNMQLIDARTDKHLWAEIFERRMTVENLFAIQTEITREVVAALNGVLSEQDREQLDARPTDSLDAYREYALGRQQMARRTGSEMKRALEHFRRATELDPNYALAWVGVADVLSLLPNYGGLISLADTFEERQVAIDKALALDPLSAEAYTALASLASDRGEVDRAAQLFERAIELDPNYATARHWYALWLRDQGRLDEALVQTRKARDVDPAAPILSLVEAGVLMNLDRPDEAAQLFRESIRRNPAFPGLRESYAGLLMNQGQLADGLRWAESAAEMAPDTPYAQLRLCLSLVDLGFADEAAECNASVMSSFPSLPLSDMIWVQIAVAVQRGEMSALVERVDGLASSKDDLLPVRLLAAVLAGELNRVEPLLDESERDLMRADVATLLEISPEMALIIASLERRNGNTERAREILDALQVMLNAGSEIDRRNQATFHVSIALERDGETAATELWRSFVEQRAITAWWILKAPGIAPEAPSDAWLEVMRSLDDYLAEQREKYLAERNTPLLP